MKFVVLVDQVEQLLKIVLLSGKQFIDLLPEEFEVVGELQRSVRKRDARFDLRAQREVFPPQSQLPQQFAERPGLSARFGVVGHGVEADVVIAFSQTIKGVKPTDRVMLLDDADFLIEVRQPDSGRQS